MGIPVVLTNDYVFGSMTGILQNSVEIAFWKMFNLNKMAVQ